MPAAANAFRIKSYSSMIVRQNEERGGVSVVAVRFVLYIVSTRHHKDPSVDMDDIDLGAIEPREHRGRNHLIDRPQRRLAATEIEHPINSAEKRVQFVRGEQNCHPKLVLQSLRERDDLTLVTG